MRFVRRNGTPDPALTSILNKVGKFLDESVSNGSGGNYRDIMPLNGRFVEVLRAEPLSLTPDEAA